MSDKDAKTEANKQENEPPRTPSRYFCPPCKVCGGERDRQGACLECQDDLSGPEPENC